MDFDNIEGASDFQGTDLQDDHLEGSNTNSAAVFHRIGKHALPFRPRTTANILIGASLVQFIILAMKPLWNSSMLTGSATDTTLSVVFSVVQPDLLLSTTNLQLLWTLVGGLLFTLLCGFYIWNVTGLLRNHESLVFGLQWLNLVSWVMHTIFAIPGYMLFFRSVTCQPDFASGAECWSSPFSVATQMFSALSLLLLISTDVIHSFMFIQTRFNEATAPFARNDIFSVGGFCVARLVCCVLYVFCVVYPKDPVAWLPSFVQAFVCFYFGKLFHVRLPVLHLKANFLYSVGLWTAGGVSLTVFFFSAFSSSDNRPNWAFGCLLSIIIFPAAATYLWNSYNKYIRNLLENSRLKIPGSSYRKNRILPEEEKAAYSASSGSEIGEDEVSDAVSTTSSPGAEGSNLTGNSNTASTNLVGISVFAGKFHDFFALERACRVAVTEDPCVHAMCRYVLQAELRRSTYPTPVFLHYALFLMNYCPHERSSLFNVMTDIERQGLSKWWHLLLFNAARYDLRISMLSGFSEESREISVQLKIVQKGRRILECLVLRFFRDIAKNKVTPESMIGLSSVIFNRTELLRLQLRTLTERFPRSAAVLREYALFTLNILRDPVRAEELLEMAEQYEGENDTSHTTDAVCKGADPNNLFSPAPFSSPPLPGSRIDALSDVGKSDSVRRVRMERAGLQDANGDSNVGSNSMPALGIPEKSSFSSNLPLQTGSNRRRRLSTLETDTPSIQEGGSKLSIFSDNASSSQLGDQEVEKLSSHGGSSAASSTKDASLREKVHKYQSRSVWLMITAMSLTVLILVIMMSVAFGLIYNLISKLDTSVTEVHKAAQLKLLGQTFSMRSSMMFAQTNFALNASFAVTSSLQRNLLNLAPSLLNDLIVNNPPVDDPTLMRLWKDESVVISGDDGLQLRFSPWDSLIVEIQRLRSVSELQFPAYSLLNSIVSAMVVFLVRNASPIGNAYQNIVEEYISRFGDTFRSQMVVTNSAILGVSLFLLFLVPLCFLLPAIRRIRKERRCLYEIVESLPKGDASRTVHNLATQFAQDRESAASMEEDSQYIVSEFHSYSLHWTLTCVVLLLSVLLLVVVAFSLEQYVLYNKSKGVGYEILAPMEVWRNYASGTDLACIALFYPVPAATAAGILALHGRFASDLSTALDEYRFGVSSRSQMGIFDMADSSLEKAFRASACVPSTSPACMSPEQIVIAQTNWFSDLGRLPITAVLATYSNAETLKKLTDWDKRLSESVVSASETLTQDEIDILNSVKSRVTVYYVVSLPLLLFGMLLIMIPVSLRIENENRQVLLLLTLLPKKTVFSNGRLFVLLSTGEIIQQKEEEADATSLNLTEALTDAVVQVDSHGEVELVNRAAEMMFGRPRDQLLGRSARTLFAVSSPAEKVAVDHVFDTLKATNSDRTEAQLNMLRHEDASDVAFPAKLTVSLQGGYLIFVVKDRTAEQRQDIVLKEEQNRSEGLLRHILPEEVAIQLKNRNLAAARLSSSSTSSSTSTETAGSPALIAKRYPKVSILFSDIAGFTESIKNAAPEEVVSVLNQLVVRFDRICKKHHIEKIKTIGDAFFAIAGLDSSRSDCHAVDAVECGLEMIASIREFALGTPLAAEWNVRVGINSGPVVGGVIGEDKFAFDCWSPAVNIASRMESTGMCGRVQVSKSTLALLSEMYSYEERERVFVKGVGEVSTALIIAKK
eukprot:ANDGO_06932.mRNA.1 Adenylate cyclase